MKQCTHLDQIKPRETARASVRRVRQTGRHLGSPETMHDMRPGGLLRFLEEQARDKALPRCEAPDHEIDRARRKLGLVLCG